MKKIKKIYKHHLTDVEQQKIAEYIVNNQHLTTKQVAYNLAKPYQTVYRVLKERVNINKTLSLRYPPS